MSLSFAVEYIKIPKLNPLRWLKYNGTSTDDFYYNLISDYEGKRYYEQPFEHGDPINTQVKYMASMVSSLKMKLVDEDMNVVATATNVPLYTTTGWSYMHFAMTAPSLTGCYYGLITLTMTDSSTQVYISEPIRLAASHEGTIAIDYGHDENDFDMVFQVGAIGLSDTDALSYVSSDAIIYRLRIEGGLWTKDKGVGSDDVTYINETHDNVLLNAVPYNIYTYSFGTAQGLPYYILDLINRIFSCANTRIEGVMYTKNEGATLEVAGVDRYSLLTGKLKLLNKENDYSKSYAIGANNKGIGYMTIAFDFIVT